MHTRDPDQLRRAAIDAAAALLQQMFGADTSLDALRTYTGPDERPRHSIQMVAQEIVDSVLTQPVEIPGSLRRLLIDTVMESTGDVDVAETVVDHLVRTFPHIGDPHHVTATVAIDSTTGAPLGIVLPPDGPALYYVAGGPAPDQPEPTVVRLDAASEGTLGELGIRTRHLIGALMGTVQHLLARTEATTTLLDGPMASWTRR